MRGRVWQRPVPRGGERRAGQAHGPMTRRETSCRREWPVTLSMIQPEKGVVGVGVLVARAGGEYRRMGGGEVEFLADRPNLRGVVRDLLVDVGGLPFRDPGAATPPSVRVPRRAARFQRQ
jgi:hypothetical protein